MLRKYGNQAEIPEPLREHYKEVGGEWVPDVPGATGGADIADLRAKINEMRDNNIGLKQKLEAFEGVDADTVRAALAALGKQQDSETASLLQKGEFDKVLAMQEQRLKAAYDAQLAALQGERDTFEGKSKKLKGQFGSILLAQKLDEALAKKKLRLQPGARDDLVARARTVFAVTDDVDDLKPVEGAFDGKGKPFTPDSWLDAQVTKAGYLFEGGGGGGAGKGGGGGGVGQVFNRDDFVGGRDPEGFAKATDAITQGKARWSD